MKFRSLFPDTWLLKARMLIEEEKNRFAQKLIDQEKLLSRNLELEIEKGEQISLELKESREQLQSILSNLAGAAYRCHFDEDYILNKMWQIGQNS
jgi:repressor of nif and glnA expression